MLHFPITENAEEALKHARDSRRDDLGYCYHTFRIRLADGKTEWQPLLSKLVDAGWQLQGAPVVIEAPVAADKPGVAEETKTEPRHLLVSMLHAEPHPLQIRGELRIHGEIRGEAELQGQLSS